jgi:hypothetical protein
MLASGTFAICYMNEKSNYLNDYLEYINDTPDGDSMCILTNGVYSFNACLQN